MTAQRCATARRRRGVAALEEILVLGVMLPLVVGLFWFTIDICDYVFKIISACVLSPIL